MLGFVITNTVQFLRQGSSDQGGFSQRRSSVPSYVLLLVTFAEWAQHDRCLCIDAIYGTGESVILLAIRPLSTICFRKRVVNQDGHRWSTIVNISLACWLRFTVSLNELQTGQIPVAVQILSSNFPRRDHSDSRLNWRRIRL